MKTILRIIFFVFISSALLATTFFLWSSPIEADDEIDWGVDYSASQATYLGLDPAETYSAIINELGAKNIKIHINWNDTEVERDVFDFSLLDTQVKEAEDKNVKLILVIGLKTGRWPECHTPNWYKSLSRDEHKTELLSYIETITKRYKNSSALLYWQVENEPLLKFGICPQWYYSDTSLLEAEVSTVRSIDSKHQIIISDSGELSSWTKAASIGDIVGVTMYRSSWNPTQKTFGINPYSFLSPEFYSTKAAVIQKYFNKPVISIELQAEPWASKPLREASLEEQALSMNPELFTENVEFAKQAGLGAYYFWGAEWWYYMKTKHNQPEIWNQATQLFSEANFKD